jgi:glyoxylase-like metal-dependent hydrolase (beta-lactamase superfamily II)
MDVIKIYPQGFAANSYIVTADHKNAVLIDCAQERVWNECVKHGLTPRYVLLTHCHYDHIGGLETCYQNGAKIVCGELEQPNLFSEASLREYVGEPPVQVELFKTLKDGEKFTLCDIPFEAILTAGHTSGGMCFVTENNLFTGDTLFFESVGRCDLPTGNERELMNSVKKLFQLTGDKKIFCGHGEDTTLEHERLHNPYVRL